VHNRSARNGEDPAPSPARTGNPPEIQNESGETSHFKYIVHYQRTGKVAFLGHLEILQIIFRALRRAKIDTNYSLGFNPSPKVSFGPALSVGTESLAEFFTVDLPAPLKDPAAAMVQLNGTLIPGLLVTGIEPHSGKIPQKMAIPHSVTLTRELREDEKEKLQEFLSSKHYFIEKTRKGKTTSIDIRPLISQLSITGDDSLMMEMISASAQPGIKVVEAITAILHLTEEDARNARIVKTGWQQMN
jgi:radical SAM-linked protein